MGKTICITTVYGRCILFCLNDNKIEFARVLDSNNDYPIGTVVLGRIKKMIPSSGACFVNIGNGCDYFFTIPKDISKLKFADGKVHDRLHTEDVLLFQIKTEAVKLKQPTLDGNISINGRYFVIEEGNGISISKKISIADRNNLCLPDKIDTYSKEFKIVVRTEVALCTNKSELETELDNLYMSMKKVFSSINTSPDYTVIYKPKSLVYQLLKELFKFGIDKIITDEEIYNEELKAISNENNIEFEFYNDDFSLYKLYKLETHVDELLVNKVYLKSGAFLVVEQGETLTAIDVNSAHAIKGDREEANLSINIEAAEEISYILKNRNISGMILVDFINMKNPANEKLLIDKMKFLLSKDNVKATYVDMTGLGLMEITRQRKYKSFKEQWRN